MKKLLFLVAVIAGFSFVACTEDPVVDNAMELSVPKNLKYETGLGKVTITWDAVTKAAGYAYSVDNAAFVEVAETKVTFTDLEAGEHNMKLIAKGDGKTTKDSKEASLDFVVSVDLAAPAATYDAETNTVSWTAVEEATGYAYKYNDGEWTKVGADVLSVAVEGLSLDEANVFTVTCTFNDVLSANETALELMLPGQAWIITNDAKYVMKADGENKFAYTFENVTDVEFEIFRDSTFSYISGSLVGGVGSFTQNIASKIDGEAQWVEVKKYVHHSNGYVMKKGAKAIFMKDNNKSGLATEDGEEYEAAAKFWISDDQPRTVKVVLDMTVEGKPAYRMDMLNYEEANVVLAERFDLFVYGSNFPMGLGGWRSLSGNDGIEPLGRFYTANTTDGFSMGDSDAPAEKALWIPNRQMEGWYLNSIAEQCGYIKLNKTAVMKTPALGYAGNVTVTFKTVLYGGNSSGFFFTTENGGTIVSATANVPVVDDPTAANTTYNGFKDETIAIADNKVVEPGYTYVPRYDNNADKGWTTFTIVIENVTADTRLVWDVDDAQNSRFCVDDIFVTK